ncbi:MAG TPA: hypothetical protein VN612_11545 [Acidobacteriaceae bacterium]|nr:hypothetical protein [Acidobacteriaceae bacterium]
MRSLTAALLMVFASLCFAAPPAKARVAAPAPMFVVRQPTIIAFFSLKPGDLQDPDIRDSYRDFQRYVASAKQQLERHGVKVEQAISTSFSVKLGTHTMRFTPVRRQCGYYFLAPGRQPQVAYGVISDDDIVRGAQRYFGDALRE